MFTLLKPYATITLFVMFSLHTFSQQPEWEWVKAGIHGNTIESRAICVDKAGNAFVAGNMLKDLITFGSVKLNNPLMKHDAYIAKYNSLGEVLWAKRLGGKDYDKVSDLACDSSGNVYISGYLRSSDFAIGTYKLPPGAGAVGFIAKLDPAGNTMWVKAFSSNGVTETESIDVDDNGNVYFTGIFLGNECVIGNIKLSSKSPQNNDVFVGKADAAGNILWAKSFGGPSGDLARSIVAGADGNIYVGAAFRSDSIFVGNKWIEKNAEMAMLLVKMNSNGDDTWVRTAGGSGTTTVQSVAVDLKGNVGVVGSTQAYTFYAGTKEIKNPATAATNYDASYIIKYSPDGTLIELDVNADVSLNDLGFDSKGNMYVAGNFLNDSVIINGVSLKIAIPGTGHDGMLVKLDDKGKVTWWETFGGESWDYATSLYITWNDELYVFGHMLSLEKNHFGKKTIAAEPGKSAVYTGKRIIK